MNVISEILIIDDESFANALRESIQEDFDVNVTVTDSHADAEKIFEEAASFNLVIVKFQPSEEQTHTIINMASDADIPIIVLVESSDVLPEDLQKNPSVVEFVSKNDSDSIAYITKIANKLIKNLEAMVMVVDDSSTQRELIKENLKIINITNVLTAVDGVEALTLLEKSDHMPSMVITDYQMPNMDGIELVKAIRKKYNKDTLSIIAFSAAEDRALPSEFLRFGANDFLSKPYESREFQTRINNNLEILRLFDENRKQKEKLKEIAFTDSQTQIYNRTKYMIMIKRYCNMYKNVRFAQNGTGLYNIYIRIKGIGAINKTYGYEKGDQTLQIFVKLIKPLLGQTESFYRVMSTEFSILSLNNNYSYVKELEEKIIHTLEKHTKSTLVNYQSSITQYNPKNKISSFSVGIEEPL